MFGNALSGWHLMILLLVVLLLFGAPKLPGLAKSIGQSMKILKKEVGELSDDSGAASKTQQQPVSQPVTQYDNMPQPAPGKELNSHGYSAPAGQAGVHQGGSTTPPQNPYAQS